MEAQNITGDVFDYKREIESQSKLNGSHSEGEMDQKQEFLGENITNKEKQKFFDFMEEVERLEARELRLEIDNAKERENYKRNQFILKEFKSKKIGEKNEIFSKKKLDSLKSDEVQQKKKIQKVKDHIQILNFLEVFTIKEIDSDIIELDGLFENFKIKENLELERDHSNDRSKQENQLKRLQNTLESKNNSINLENYKKISKIQKQKKIENFFKKMNSRVIRARETSAEKQRNIMMKAIESESKNRKAKLLRSRKNVQRVDSIVYNGNIKLTPLSIQLQKKSGSKNQRISSSIIQIEEGKSTTCNTKISKIFNKGHQIQENESKEANKICLKNVTYSQNRSLSSDRGTRTN